jgi:hypothetical protein
MAAASKPAMAGRRRTHFGVRRRAPTGRAVTGSPPRNRRRSSANARDVGYRRPGAFSSALAAIVSTSPRSDVFTETLALASSFRRAALQARRKALGAQYQRALCHLLAERARSSGCRFRPSPAGATSSRSWVDLPLGPPLSTLPRNLLVSSRDTD